MLYPGALYIDGTIAEYISIYYGVEKKKTSNMLPLSAIFGTLLMPVGTYFI